MTPECAHNVPLDSICSACTNDGHMKGLSFDLAAWNKQVGGELRNLTTSLSSNYFSSDPMIKMFAQTATMQVECIKNQLRILMLAKGGSL